MSAEERIPPLAGQVFQVIPYIEDYEPENEEYNSIRESTVYFENATVTTSSVVGSSKHKPVLDIDLPAKLVPSSTKGHFLLYIDYELTWANYSKLIKVMAEVGLLEEGYVGASLARGYTSARLPWVKKEGAA